MMVRAIRPTRIPEVTLVARDPALRRAAVERFVDGTSLRLVADRATARSTPAPSLRDLVLVEAGWSGAWPVVDALFDGEVDAGARARVCAVDLVQLATADFDLPRPRVAESDLPSRVASVLDRHLADPDFGVRQLAQALGRSQRQLLREVRRDTGLSVSELIRRHRLETARMLLRTRACETVAEIAGRVGMSPSYLTRSYSQWTGRSPSDLLRAPSEPSEP